MVCRRPLRKNSGKLSICLNVQRGVVTPVDGVGDGRNPGGVADDPDKGSGAVQRLHHIGTGSLAKGADHGFAGDQDLVPYGTINAKYSL